MNKKNKNEKHTALTVKQDASLGDGLSSLHFYNDKREFDSPGQGQLPANIIFYPSGNVREMWWYRDGVHHRENDLPAFIEFADNPNNQIIHASWHMNGQEHREGDLPSTIMVCEYTNEVTLLQFRRHGADHSIDGLPPYIWINCDGSTEDEDGKPIEVDLSRYHGDLPRPPKTTIPPFFQPG